MSRWTWWLVGAVLVLGPTVASRGEDPPLRDLTPAPKWVVGNVMTRTEEVSMVLEDHTGGPGYPAASSKNTSVVAATWLEECKEANAAGERTAYRAYVQEWRQTGGEAEDTDTSLKGRFVLVKGSGAERTWKMEGDDKRTSPGAAEWLDRAFGPGERDYPVRTMLPSNPVATGATWKPAMDQFADIALGSKDAVDLSRVAGDVTFKAVEGDVAVVGWDLGVPWKFMPVEGEKPFTKGGVWHITGEARVGTDGRVGAAMDTWSMTVEGQGEVMPIEDGNGPLVKDFKLSAKVRRTRELKGEMPKPATPR